LDNVVSKETGASSGMLNIRSILQYATLIIVLLLALDAFYSIGATCYQIGDHAAENYYSIKNCSIFDGPFLAAMIWFANIFDHHGEAIVAAFTVILAISVPRPVLWTQV
jgi:hypothetical protein